MNRISTTRLLLLAAFLVTVSISATASAQECETDSDCGAGYICEVQGTAGCGGDDDCIPVNYSECVQPRMTCESDSDCPAPLTCGASDSSSNVPCTVTPDGEEDCGQGGAIAPSTSYCIYEPPSCETNDDCPENFECYLYDTTNCAVPAPTCPEGEACEAPEEPNCSDDAPSEGFCEPREITCEANSDCPGDWTCELVGATSCGSAGSAGAPDCTEEGCDEDAVICEGEGCEQGRAPECTGDDCGEPQECQPEETYACLPPWADAAGDLNVGGSRDDDSTPTNTGNPESNDGTENMAVNEEEDTGGCAVSSGQPGQSGPVGLLAVLMGLALIGLRRRA